jgi:hypothetical protein
LKPRTFVRVLRDSYFPNGLRHAYWNTVALATEIAHLFLPNNTVFRRHVFRDMVRFLFDTVNPIAGETTVRAHAAVAWLLRAQQATPDSGVALGYFPCSANRMAWRPSYPETTGYIITSLIDYGRRYHNEAARNAALRMARWEISIQMSSGAVQGGPVCEPKHQTAAAFNTGMVLDGWCSAYADTHDASVLAAARRAADFLLNDLNAEGYFRTNGAFVGPDEIKTYTCLCAWALYRFGELISDARYVQAAIKCAEAALRQQQPNGWFAHNCLVRPDVPLTHTIGYTLQGVLEVGVLAKREDFISAVRRCADAIMPRITRHGYLPGMFYADWEPGRFSSCLTGAAQIAVVFYRLAEETESREYRLAADKLVNYLKSLQELGSGLSDINGALPGSFPLFGEYMRAGYPNWATKYFLDALILQNKSRGGM